jgi:hypothetical protein
VQANDLRHIGDLTPAGSPLSSWRSRSIFSALTTTGISTRSCRHHAIDITRMQDDPSG